MKVRTSRAASLEIYNYNQVLLSSNIDTLELLLQHEHLSLLEFTKALTELSQHQGHKQNPDPSSMVGDELERGC